MNPHSGQSLKEPKRPTRAETNLKSTESIHNFSISSISLPSTATPSESLFSGSAGTSLSVRGPGSLAGKAIWSLGKMTLKGVERLIISRKLYAIGSQSRSLRSSEMYNDILELSRPQMYSDTIHGEAMRVLVRQIASRRIHHLLEALKNWHPIEIRLLLSELIARFEDTVKSPSKPPDSIIRAYKLNLSTRPSWDDHSFVPFIEFLRQFISTRSPSSSFSLCSITLEAGLLDFVLHLYLSDFRDPLAPPSDRTKHYCKSVLSIACNSLIMSICEHQDETAATIYIQQHPIHALWSIHPALPVFTYNPQDVNANAQRMLRRREVWSGLEKRWIRWRIISVYDSMTDQARTFEKNFLRDAFVDLIHFAGSESYEEEEIPFRALRALHQLLFWEAYWPDGVYLFDDHTLAYANQVFPRIIQRLLAVLEDPSHPYFFFDFDKQPFRQIVVTHFIHWASRVGSRRSRFRRLMLESGILGLIEAAKKQSALTFNPNDPQSLYPQEFLSWAAAISTTDSVTAVHLPFSFLKMEWSKVMVDPPDTEMLYKWIDGSKE